MIPTGSVFITGGAGFLGRGVLRRAFRENWNASFTVYSRDEQKHVNAAKYGNARFVIGDVLDVDRLTLAMTGHDYVIHAAALKYIPEGEFNASECVRVNIGGTQAVIEAARAAGVQRVVVISTDKAASPINTYGMTKAVAERLVGETSQFDTETYVTACRYGNVVGSTGSIVPVFKRQLEERGKVTLTNPDMTRYWISIQEAVDIIIEAFDALPGHVVIPQPMAMRTGDLALELVEGDRSKIEVVGLRPGEKMHEDLLTEQEALRTTAEGRFYHMAPPTSKSSFDDVGPLRSCDPHFWMTAEQMLELIEDARTV